MCRNEYLVLVVDMDGAMRGFQFQQTRNDAEECCLACPARAQETEKLTRFDGKAAIIEYSIDAETVGYRSDVEKSHVNPLCVRVSCRSSRANTTTIPLQLAYPTYWRQ